MDVSSGSGGIVVDLDDINSFPHTESFAEGAVIILEARPSFGYVFDGWGGSIVSHENPEYIIIDCNKTVTAGFSLDWRLMGIFCGILVLIGTFAVIMVIRRRTPSQ